MENKKMPAENNALFDNPKNVKRFLHFLYVSCALLLVLEFFNHRHISHIWENLWGFYPIYSFVSCVVLVLTATWLRTFIMRPETYYDIEKKTYDGKDNDDDVGKQNVDV